MICLMAATSSGFYEVHSCRILMPVLVEVATKLSAFVLVDLRREMMTYLVEKTMRMTTYVVVVVATMR